MRGLSGEQLFDSLAEATGFREDKAVTAPYNPGASLASSSSANQNFGIITATVGTNGVVGSNGRRIQIGGILQF